jgi:hypothetical protein
VAAEQVSAMAPTETKPRWLRTVWELWRTDLTVRDNPFSVRDLRSRVRGFRFPVLLLVYHGAILLVGLIGVATYSGMAMQSGIAAGRFIFPFLAYVQMVLAPMVCGTLTASAMTIERERQTLDLLTVSTMRGLQVALGKFAIPWALTLLVGLTSLPYLLLCVAAGGVSFSDILIFSVGLAVFTALVGAFGLVISCASRSSAAAVVQTVVVYGLGLLLSSVATAAVVSIAAMSAYRPGAAGPQWTSMCLGLTPLTWVTALVAPELGATAPGVPQVPYWLPGLVLWAPVIAYMLCVAGCRAGTAPRRHLITRRVLGTTVWVLICVVIVSTLLAIFSARPASAPGLFSIMRKGSSEIDALIIGSALITLFSCCGALASSMGDSDWFLAGPLRRLVRSGILVPRPLSPEPEQGLALGLTSWFLGIGVLLIALRLTHLSLVPMGWNLALLVLLPQLGCVIFAAFVGLRATVRLPYKPKERRLMGTLYFLPLIVWPLVVCVGAAIAANSLRLGTSGTAVWRIGCFLQALSPLTYPTLAGLTSVQGASQSLWAEVGGISIHPAHLAAASSLLLPLIAIALFIREARAWQRYCDEWWNSQPRSGVS